MKYRVIMQPLAKRELAVQYEFISRQSPRDADRWFNRFLLAIEGLSTFPERCSMARESTIAGCEVRQLLFGKGQGVRRALFVIQESTVRVLCIRHAARGEATVDELFGEA